MKKIIIIMSLLSFLVCDGISGVTYFQYGDGTFNLSRVYFTYKKTISDDLSFTFQTDVTQSKYYNDVDAAYDGNWDVYLKKAQLDWKKSGNMLMSIGLIGMNVFNVQEKTWGKRFIFKSALDEQGVAPSADLGIGLTKDFDAITASLFITNGEGYKEHSEFVDEVPRYSLQLVAGEKRLDKNNGYNYGIVFSSLRNAGLENETKSDEAAAGFFCGFSTDELTAGAEYNKLKWEDNESSLNGVLTSVYGTYAVNENMDAFIRIDNYDVDDGFLADDIEISDRINIIGFSFTPIEGLTISPNYIEFDSKETNTDTGDVISESDSEDFKLNFQFTF